MLASPPVQRIAAMAHAGGAYGAIWADTRPLSQRQRADGNRPEFADDSSEPTPDIRGRFNLPHVYVIAYMYTIQFSSNLFWPWAQGRTTCRTEQIRLPPPALVVSDEPG